VDELRLFGYAGKLVTIFLQVHGDRPILGQPPGVWFLDERILWETPFRRDHKSGKQKNRRQRSQEAEVRCFHGIKF
jgi:hypothetical protein